MGPWTIIVHFALVPVAQANGQTLSVGLYSAHREIFLSTS